MMHVVSRSRLIRTRFTRRLSDAAPPATKGRIRFVQSEDRS